MSERKEKSPEQVSDEDYKIAPTSADKEIVKRDSTWARKKGNTVDESHEVPEAKVQEELREGVE
jgi:hypothetical protein